MDSNDLMGRIISEYDNKTEFAKEFDSTCSTKDKLKIINLIVNKYNCGFDEARMVCDYFIDGVLLPTTASSQEIAAVTTMAQEKLNVPRCVVCNSTNLSKITTTSKAVSVGLFGIFSQKVKKQFHCNSCGYEW